MPITCSSSIRLSAIAAAVLVALALAGCNNPSSSDSADAQAADQASNEMVGEANSKATSADKSSEYANDEDIRKHIVGYTITGKMSSGGQYGEYYAEDGTIKAADYTAKWQVKNNQLCWDYDNDKSLDCYDVKFSGQDVTWYKDGEIKGNGTAVPGNTNNF